ncbi:MAG: VCBS repeat-containing protein [Fuerstiella sp.]
MADIDNDGDRDILVAILRDVWPTDSRHGQVVVLINDGKFSFHSKILADDLRRVTDVQPADLDGDGDMDVVLASMFNDWKTPGTTSLAWLENDGRQQFDAWHIAAAPTYLATVACGDLNDDGRADIVAGSLQIFPPFDSAPAGVSIWLNQFSADRSSAEVP